MGRKKQTVRNPMTITMVHRSAKTPSGKMYLRLNLSAITTPRSDVTKFCVIVLTDVEILGSVGRILLAAGLKTCSILLDDDDEERVPEMVLFDRQGLFVKFAEHG